MVNGNTVPDVKKFQLFIQRFFLTACYVSGTVLDPEDNSHQQNPCPLTADILVEVHWRLTNR